MKLASEVSEALPLNLESPVAPFSSSEKTCPPLAYFVSSSDLGLVCFVVLPLPPMVSQPVCDGEETVFWYETLQRSAYSASVFSTYAL